ncbi:MAG: hypothetical protein Q9159_004699 [Coniocarpon cinnabarinum]
MSQTLIISPELKSCSTIGMMIGMTIGMTIGKTAQALGQYPGPLRCFAAPMIKDVRTFKASQKELEQFLGPLHQILMRDIPKDSYVVIPGSLNDRIGLVTSDFEQTSDTEL